MRINRYVATASGLSRRAADQLIEKGRVTIDGQNAVTGQVVSDNQQVVLDGKHLKLPTKTTTILLNKPIGYVVSRKGQGAPTIYTLLPENFRQLKPIGRLDKESSGLLVLTNDGNLSQQLTHPKFKKPKTYQVSLDKVLLDKHKKQLTIGVALDDGLSKLAISNLKANNLTVIIYEGRKRQIRRSFEVLGYKVTHLHRTTFANYKLDNLNPGKYKEV